MAISHQECKQYAPALTIINNLISRFPNESGLYISRAILFNKLGDRKAASADFDKAISVDPSNYEAHYQRGLDYLHSSSIETAKAYFDKAISLLTIDIEKNPQNAPLILKKAEILEQSGHVAEALAEYDNYLLEWDMSRIVLEKIALLNYTQEKFNAVIDAYTLIIKNFAGGAELFYARSLAFQKMHDLEKALEDVNQAVSFAPSNYTYLYHRASIKYQLNDETGYKSDLQASGTLLNAIQKKRALNQHENEMLASITNLLKN